jgi:hypothetical protein
MLSVDPLKRIQIEEIAESLGIQKHEKLPSSTRQQNEEERKQIKFELGLIIESPI